MTIGYIKRGRGYKEVQIIARYQWPTGAAVKWRGIGETGPCTKTPASDVLAEKPLTPAQESRKRFYKNLLSSLTSEWQSMSALAASFVVWHGVAVWQMCKSLERDGLCEVRRVKFKYGKSARCWRSEARLKKSLA